MSRRATPIPVRSLAEGLRLYTEVLHFEVESRHRESVIVRGPDGHRYELAASPAPATIQIRVGNPPDLVDALHSAGCRITSGMWNMDSRTVFEDQNHNRIIVQRTGGQP